MTGHLGLPAPGPTPATVPPRTASPRRRYMVILRYGGVYADVDVECRKPLDDVIRPTDTLVVGWEVEVSSDERARQMTYIRKRQVGCRGGGLRGGARLLVGGV